MFRALGILLLLVSFADAQVGEKPFTMPDWVAAEVDLSYGPEAAQKVDVYRPKNAQGEAPGVLLIHGGGWTQGSRKSVLRVYAIPFLREGFVVASVDYRMSGEAKAPAAVTDVLTALKWFRDNAKRFQVDRDRIITAGDSAGGHLALMAGMITKSAKLGPVTDVAAIINIYGPADVGELLAGENKLDVADAWIPQGATRREVARAVSPIIYVRKGLPPVKSVHGTKDDLVPYEQTVRLTKALRDQGVSAELISVAGGGHGFEDAVWNETVYPQVFEFLRRHRVLR